MFGPLPVYITLFIISNVKSINNMKYKSKVVKIAFWISCLTCIVSAVTIPESYRTGGSYVFWGLVKDLDKVIIFGIMGYISAFINFITVIIGFCSKRISNIKNKKLEEEI